ncbi:MAG: hypothetical protein M1820_008628 [Bogoriella megaspora]|nr:MAG: hypothetical protein M1820_008628 [Bogoriella megaspora]
MIKIKIAQRSRNSIVAKVILNQLRRGIVKKRVFSSMVPIDLSRLTKMNPKITSAAQKRYSPAETCMSTPRQGLSMKRCRFAYAEVKKLKKASATDPKTPIGIRKSSRGVNARFMPQYVNAMPQAIILVTS